MTCREPMETWLLSEGSQGQINDSLHVMQSGFFKA